MKIYANGKINLAIRVFPKAQGEDKHEIDAIFVPYLKVFDVIEINKSKKDSFKLAGPFQKWVDVKKNTVISAINLFRKKYDIKDKFNVVLTKNIPVQSGLGGPSSDAAFTLMYLADVYNVHKYDLLDIAIEIGSDVPFFFYNKIARVSGKGEKVQLINCEIEGKWEVAITQDIHCSTKEIFNQFDKLNELEICDIPSLVAYLERDKFEKFFTYAINMLEKPAFSLYPKLKLIKEELKRHFDFVVMTGSGSSFVVFHKV